jgi:hypothetical protein
MITFPAKPPAEAAKADTLLYLFPRGEPWRDHPAKIMHGMFHALHSYTRENYSMMFTPDGVLSTERSDRIVSAAIFHQFAECFLTNESNRGSSRDGAHERAIKMYTDCSIVSGVVWQFRENRALISASYSSLGRIEELTPAIHGFQDVYTFLRSRIKPSEERALAFDIKDGPGAWRDAMKWSAAAHLAFQLLHNTVNAFERTDLDTPDKVADNGIVQSFKALSILGDKDLIPKENLPSAFILLKSERIEEQTHQVVVGESDIKAQFNNPELMARFEADYDLLKVDPALKPVFKALFDRKASSYLAATSDFSRITGLSSDALDALKEIAKKDPSLLKEQVGFLTSNPEILKDVLALTSSKNKFAEGLRAVAKIFTDERYAEIKSVFSAFLSRTDKQPLLELLLRNFRNKGNHSATDLKMIIDKTTDTKVLSDYLQFLQDGHLNKASALVWFCGKQDADEQKLKRISAKLVAHSGDLSQETLQNVIAADLESAPKIIPELKPVRSTAQKSGRVKDATQELPQSPAVIWANNVGLRDVIAAFSPQKFAVFESEYRVISIMPGLIPEQILSNGNLAHTWLKDIVPYPDRCDRLATLLTAAVPLTADLSNQHKISPYTATKKLLAISANN